MNKNGGLVLLQLQALWPTESLVVEGSVRILSGAPHAAWGVRPDGSSQGGYLVYASSHDLHAGKEAPVGIIDWKSWKLSRKCRSSLAAESQAMADAIDTLNIIRLFIAGCLYSQGIDLRQPDRILPVLP